MDKQDTYFKLSGYTETAWVCGRCRKNPLPEVTEPARVKVKIIMCPYCFFAIPNKPAGEDL